ncbi:Transcriptional regulator SlyA [Paraburkholderia phenoliruptrix]|uniref:Transcriptional regulator SlyA n=3 Tax=Paraburkholderia phenoliruptrix TaxID=252970 RepID=A0A6J5K6L6_9BURK|nr:Transcriptional regulator SlyA [Paraburkholderia phenoliruptrix]
MTTGFREEALSYNPRMETQPAAPARPAQLAQLEERFGFLVSDVGRLSGKRFDDLAKSSVDLTRAQCRVLAYLAHYGDINQARLADLLEVAPISAGRLLDRMEEGGWIERAANPQDRRERQVRMTPKAERALGKAREVGDAVALEALNGFSKEEAAQLITLLQRVRGNLSRLVDR